MGSLDILFIHPPRNYDYALANAKQRSSFMLMPMGLLGMADLLDKEGYSVKILNYSLERILDKKFSLKKYIKKNNPRMVGVSLHWIMHSAGAIETLRFVKKNFPGVFTLLGGYSATWYANEIMSIYDFVDGVIKGDAEVPILQLVKDTNNLESVQNLVYRKDGKIKDNGITYVADEIDSLNFSRLRFIEHWKEYIHHGCKTSRLSFPVEISRGCPFNCIFCGGSRYSMEKMVNRSNVIFRSPRRVVDDLKELLELGGVDSIFFGHGVYSETEEYFMEIQRLVREEGIDVNAELEVWRLPVSNRFLDDFARTFNKSKSVIWFSVRNFSSRYRKKFNTIIGNFDDSMDFTGKQLKVLVDETRNRDLTAILFWDIGYPGETILEACHNYLSAQKMNIYNWGHGARVAQLSTPMLISPGCPADLFQERLGITLNTITFQDHMKYNKANKMVVEPWDIQQNFRTRELHPFILYIFNKFMWFMNGLSFIPLTLYYIWNAIMGRTTRQKTKKRVANTMQESVEEEIEIKPVLSDKKKTLLNTNKKQK